MIQPKHSLLFLAFSVAVLMGVMQGTVIYSLNAESEKFTIASTVGPNPTFAAPSHVLVGTTPKALVEGDINDDSKLDVVTVNKGSNNVSILLNDGTGLLGNLANYDVGVGPIALGLGDFNSDGEKDIAVGNQGDQTISILTNNGDGTFGTAANFNIGSGLNDIVVGDFNNDGKSDIALASTDIIVLINDGSGSFVTTHYSGGEVNNSIAAADFNKDGNMDLTVAGRPQVLVFFGNGGGLFGTSNPVYTCCEFANIQAVDLTQDDNIDIIVSPFIEGEGGLLINDGSGNFEYITLSGVGQVDVLEIFFSGDLNGDSHGEIVTGGDDVVINLNNGDNTNFTALQGLADQCSIVSDVRISDLNSDGKNDIFYTCSGNAGNFVVVHINTTGSPPPGNTPVGTNIMVQPVDNTTGTTPVKVTFANVTVEGNTTLTTGVCGKPAPSKHREGEPSNVYDLATTASVTGNVNVCVTYTGVTFDNERFAEIFQFEGGTWVKKTVSRDLATDTICADTTTLGTFAIFETLSAAPVPPGRGRP